MPIVPRYDSIEREITVPNIPIAPVDNTLPGLMRGVSAIAQEVSGATTEMAAKKQRLADTTTLSERYLQARQEMDSAFNDLQSTPDQHTDAPKVWSNTVQKLAPKWTQGLSQELAARLNRELIAPTLEYNHKATVLQNHALVDNAKSSISQAGDFLENEAVRLDYTDERAFEGLLPKRSPTEPRDMVGAELISAGEGGSAIGATSTEVATKKPSQFDELVDGYVAQGLLSKTEGLQIKQQTRERAAYARAVRLASDEPQRYVDLMKQEDAAKGSTFLAAMDPVKRTSVLVSAKDRIKTLEHDALQTQERIRLERERQDKELSAQTDAMAAQKLAEPDKYGTLTMEWLDRAADLRLLSAERYEHYKNMINTQATEGGPGNPATIRRFSTDVYAPPKSYEATRADLMASFQRGDVPRTLYSQWMNHLEEKIKSQEGAPPTMKEQHTQAQSLVRESLKSRGPMQNINPNETVVVAEAMKALDDNARAGYPEPPLSLVQRRLPEWMTRVDTGLGTVASVASSDKRKALGLPPRADDKGQDIPNAVAQTVQQLRALPPGLAPSDPRMRDIRERLERLKELDAIEQAMKRVTRDQIRDMRTPSTPKPDATSAPRSYQMPNLIPPVGQR